MNNKIIFLFCLLLSNVVFIHATTGAMCTVKRDASYAWFTQFSNDMEAYEKFFNKTFSECTASTSTIYYDSQTPDNTGNTKIACRLKRESGYSTFTYFSNDMILLCIREKVLRILQVTVSKNEPKDKSESDNFTFFEKNDERNSSSPYKVHTESTRKIHSFQGSTNNYYSDDEKAEEQDDVEEVDVEKNKNNFHFD